MQLVHIKHSTGWVRQILIMEKRFAHKQTVTCSIANNPKNLTLNTNISVLGTKITGNLIEQIKVLIS